MRDDPEPLRRRWPARPLGEATALLTAAEVYPALERAVVAARRSVWLWFRVFDPTLDLVSEEGRAVGATWAELLAARAEDGVDVALAIADFDALARPELHAATWRAARALEGARRRGVTVLIADHGARPGWLWRLAMTPLSLWRADSLRRRLNVDPTLDLDDMPALARTLVRRDGRVVWRAPVAPPLKPRTHHQKLAVFDGGARCILGGVDVDRRRWDDPRHRRPAPDTWRDLSVGVDGPVARDAAAFFATLWREEAARLGGPDLRDAPPTPPAGATRGGGRAIRLSVTRSEGARYGGLRPRAATRTLEADHLALIGEARRLIYIETQFLRSTAIARALGRQAAAAPALELILVLPAAPEAVAFDGLRGPGARYGEHLQARCVRRLRRAFGPRLAAVSPARRRRRNADDRSALAGAGVIYVHTKALIADDAAAIVSSANLNGRSLRWDTESGVVVRCHQTAAGWRRRLSETLLPPDAPAAAFALSGAAAAWNACAEADAARPPADRDGFLLPYDARPARRFGRPLPLAPEELV